MKETKAVKRQRSEWEKIIANEAMDKELISKMETARANPMVLADPAPMARLARHGDSALEYTLRVWCNSADYWPLNFDLMEQVRDAFDKADIEIPYPQMDVHTR